MMNENTQHEENTDILALAVYALRKWKWLLAAVLIGALLFGLYKGVLHPEKSGSVTEIEELQAALGDNTKQILKNEEEIAANNRGIAERQEKIAANEELLTTQQELQDTLQEMLFALRITLEQSQEVLTDQNVSLDLVAEMLMQMITLSDSIRDMDDQLNTASNRVSNTKKEITTWQAEIDKMTATNETLDESNGELQQEIKEQEAEMARLNENAGMGTVIKFAMVGAMLGAFIFCSIIALQFMLYTKLRTANELKEQYSLPILGEFWSAAFKNHNKFDRMLDRLTGDVQTLPEEMQVYKLIAAGIQTASFPLPVQLAVTGTAGEGTMYKVGEQLHRLLPEGYKVTVAVNPVYNPDLLANLKRYTVLLVEEKGVSDKREIAKLAEVLLRNEIKVIGAVVR